MPSGWTVVATSAALLVGALPLAAADGHSGMNMTDSGTMPETSAVADVPLSYFRYHHQGGWMFAHVALMILGWALVLPVAVMLSVARSKYHIPAQILFHILNGLGVVTGFVYTHSTPDLYSGNAHRPVGWVVMSATIVWTLTSLVTAYGKSIDRRKGHALAARHLTRHNNHQPYVDSPAPRHSQESSQGAELNFSSSIGYRHGSSGCAGSPYDEEKIEEDSSQESEGLLGRNKVDRFLSRNVTRFTTTKLSTPIRVMQVVLEKLLLILGFAAIASGFIVYGGLFREREIFNGMAHFCKGGIFFWYGLLTLSRWLGTFGEFGWAWNVRPREPLVPRWKTRIPSAEFVESFVIWLYGASNVFMEHMNKWGQAWSPQDFEHVSITVLFFGGGLLGMLIESVWVPDVLNTTVLIQQSRQENADEVASFRFPSHASAGLDKQELELWTPPPTYKTSLNPMPALVILLLGLMMSSHHQSSMVSTMMHSQWGTLFAGYAVARAATYFLLYIKPPASHYPARPPSELVAAFCLTAGGLMFMMSSRDTVSAIESNGLDAMTIFTVTMGLAAVILAWEVVVFCIKGWAVRKVRASAN